MRLYRKNRMTSLSCYAKMLKKDMGKIDMNWDAAKVERYIRGMNSWPSAYAEFRGKTLKLWRANVLPWNTGHKPGMVVDVLKIVLSFRPVTAVWNF